MLTPEMAGKSVATPPPIPASLKAPTNLSVTRAKLDVEVHANELDEDGNLRHCDVGTVPIRRRTASDLAQFATLRDLYKKSKGDNSATGNIGTGAPPSAAGYEYALKKQYVLNWGGNSFLGIWSPFLASNGDHSISQIWVTRGGSSSLESAEVGWSVDRATFGDAQPHLFIYWTRDNYNNTGCYDLDCAGFVQTDNSVLLGGSGASSTIGGTQYWLQLTWVRDSSGSWWLLYAGTTWVGYYSASQYTHGMANQADAVAFGGEVYNSEPGGKHTGTDMGSGDFASQGYANAAFQGRLLYIPNTNPIQAVDLVPNNTGVTNSACYSLTTGYETQNGSDAVNAAQAVPMNGYFEFFGGPGYSSNCP
jgi:hypothetical protein